MFYFDPLYLGLILLTVVISGAAQAYVQGTFRRFQGVANTAGATGADVAARLARVNAMQGGGRASLATMGIALSPGTLSDHFDPRRNEIGLSADVANSPSVAAMAVAAHEVGHAQQHADRSPMMTARTVLVPAVSLSPTVSYILILMGLFLGITGLVTVGIVFFGLAVAFALLTVPIEIDASRRGLRMLDEAGLLGTGDREGAQKVLTAAAFTYIAAAVTAILQLLYYVSLARRRG